MRGEANPAEARLERVRILVEHQPPFLQDAHPVGERLHAAQVVCGDEDGDAAVGQLANHFLEQRFARDHVETQGRIVENDQVRRHGQRQRERDLLFLSLRQRAEAVGQRHAERAHTRLERRLVPARVEAAAEAGQPSHRHLRRRVRLLGDHAHPLHQRAAPGPGVVAEQTERPLVRPALPEQTANQRRLAGAVAPEQRVDRAAIHVQRDVVHGDAAAVADGDVVNFQDRLAHEILLCSRTMRSNADWSSSTASSSSAPRAMAVLA